MPDDAISMTPMSKAFSFDPNEGGGTMLPSPSGPIYSAEHYALQFEAHAKAFGHDGVESFVKALQTPPNSLAFSRISYMPETYNKGVLQWPGIAAESLAKIAKENIAPQMIIGMRIADVLRYAQPSNQAWRPGWRITHLNGDVELSDMDRKQINAAKQFLINCNIETGPGDARVRDEAKLSNFQGFLSKIVRDSLTFDGIAIWTDMDIGERVKAFSALPAQNIRLAGPAGYEARPEEFAVMVDEGGGVQQSFTRDQLVWSVRNPRTDQTVGGYGWSELEIGVRLIQGFQNAVDLNTNTFNRNSIPNGILTLSGGQVTQRQLDVINRIWTNLKQGITKSWALPVIGLQGDGKLELINLSDIKGQEIFYQDFMNMIAGAFCTIYRFPVRRLGYRISGGHGKDTEPWSDSGDILIDEEDPGLAPLLNHLESVINEYLISSRWPHLRFEFSGKTPKEDARQYEATRNAMTWGEARTAAALPSLEDVVEGEDEKILARLMEMAPIDANLAGVFQSIAATYIKAKFEVEEDAATPGNQMPRSADPAKGEKHGHNAGMRRNSRVATGGVR